MNEYSELFKEIKKLLNEKVPKKLDIEFVHGYITAIVCSPNEVDDDYWFNFLMWDEHEGIYQKWETQESEVEAFDFFMDAYDEIEFDLHSENFVPLISPEIETETVVMCIEWCKGFALGVGLWGIKKDELEDYLEYVSMIFYISGLKENKDKNNISDGSENAESDENIKQPRLAISSFVSALFESSVLRIDSKHRGFNRVLRETLRNKISLEYAHGYMTSIVLSPKFIPPDIWTKELWDTNGELVFLTDDENANTYFDFLKFENTIIFELSEEEYKPLMENSSTESQKEWCNGFADAFGHWKDKVIGRNDLIVELAPILNLSEREFFEEDLSRKVLMDLVSEHDKTDISKNIRTRVYNLYYTYEEMKKIKSMLPYVAEPKTGRNDPCPCGSGKKYKKCCGK